MDEIRFAGVTRDGVLKFQFVPPKWHVEIEGQVIASFATRTVAEEYANAENDANLEDRIYNGFPIAIYCLCDCTERDCKYYIP